jgi:hypothetical protein
MKKHNHSKLTELKNDHNVKEQLLIFWKYFYNFTWEMEYNKIISKKYF